MVPHNSRRVGAPGPDANSNDTVPDRNGQALAEFAIVIPVLALVIAGIIQFGLIFWSQQTLTQIARDTGRWAATQKYCGESYKQLVADQANIIAGRSSLFGYTANSWSPDTNVDPDWSEQEGDCLPADNSDEMWVTITLNHQIPLFFPWVPGNGSLSTSAEFRMEPSAS